MEDARKRQLCTPEMEQEELRARQALQWYADFQLLYNDREDFVLTRMYDEINLDPPLMQERNLFELKARVLPAAIVSPDAQRQLDRRLQEIDAWKAQCMEMRDSAIRQAPVAPGPAVVLLVHNGSLVQ